MIVLTTIICDCVFDIIFDLWPIFIMIMINHASDDNRHRNLTKKLKHTGAHGRNTCRLTCLAAGAPRLSNGTSARTVRRAIIMCAAQHVVRVFSWCKRVRSQSRASMGEDVFEALVMAKMNMRSKLNI